MRKAFLFIVVSLFAYAFSGCVASSFVKTGETYPALDPAADVKVYLTIKPDKYTEVGILNTSGGTLSSRIEKAKKEARKVGSNGIIPKKTVRTVQNTGPTEYEVEKADATNRVKITKDEHSVPVELQEFVLIRVE